MCGIAGYWGNGTRDVLTAMNDTLKHRGPDDEGVYLHNAVGLAHRRLSIVDLSPTGHQPMSTKDGRFTIVFNGEIYNHEALRKEFLSTCSFQGTSDTEVLLYLYATLGPAFLTKLEGMFACALYDREKGTLLLARDPRGKKPLYWTHHKGTLIFGSELKAIHAHPAAPRTLSRTAIAQYLVYEYIPGPQTAFEEIESLRPGTYLVFDGVEIVQTTYRSTLPNMGTYTKGFSEATQDLSTLLKEAVACRMVADVPVGVFLSGGLDSSAVSYFAQEVSAQQIKTFSIGFEDASFNESAYARDVARALGTDHHERIVGTADLLRVIEKIPDALDTPMADSSIVPTLLLSEFTSSLVKVALGGDGADELFYGYDTFFAHRIGEYYAHVPSTVRNGVAALVARLPVSHRYMSLDFKLKKFTAGFDTSASRRNTYWLSAFLPEELDAVLQFSIEKDTLLAPTDAWYRGDHAFWDMLSREYMEGYLVEDILMKVDRASMAYGLEVRAPFLDTRLVSFAHTLPYGYRRRGVQGKRVLKEAMRGRIPDHIIDRKKKGFNIPIGSWIRGPLKDFFAETILDGELTKSGLFKRAGLVILLESHLDGTRDNRKKLWTLLVLALWMKKWNGNYSN